MANRNLPSWWDHDDDTETIAQAKKRLLPLVRATWPRMREYLWAEQQQAESKLRSADPSDIAAVAKAQGVLLHIERMLTLDRDIRDLEDRETESVQSDQ